MLETVIRGCPTELWCSGTGGLYGVGGIVGDYWRGEIKGKSIINFVTRVKLAQQ